MAWQGEGVAEKEVGRGRSSRGLLMIVSFCSIVCSLVAGSSGSRALAGFFAQASAKECLLARKLGPTLNFAQPIGRAGPVRLCTTPISTEK